MLSVIIFLAIAFMFMSNMKRRIRENQETHFKKNRKQYTVSKRPILEQDMYIENRMPIIEFQ